MNFIKVLQQIKIWNWAAKVLPLTALCFAIATYCLGFDTLLQQFFVVTITTFFAIAVFWWWWTMANIKSAMQYMADAAQGFKELTENLKELNNDMGNRKRPEQENN